MSKSYTVITREPTIDVSKGVDGGPVFTGKGYALIRYVENGQESYTLYHTSNGDTLQARLDITDINLVTSCPGISSRIANYVGIGPYNEVWHVIFVFNPYDENWVVGQRSDKSRWIVLNPERLKLILEQKSFFMAEIAAQMAEDDAKEFEATLRTKLVELDEKLTALGAREQGLQTELADVEVQKKRAAHKITEIEATLEQLGVE